MDRSTIVDRSAYAAARGAARSHDVAARRFGALADPARLRILSMLQDDPRCVCELRDDLRMASNLLSYHLRILREAGLVEGERRGRRIEYRLLPQGLARARDDLERLREAPS